MPSPSLFKLNSWQLRMESLRIYYSRETRIALGLSNFFSTSTVCVISYPRKFPQYERKKCKISLEPLPIFFPPQAGKNRTMLLKIKCTIVHLFCLEVIDVCISCTPCIAGN